MKTGDRVVCVKKHTDSRSQLKVGAIYVIKDIMSCTCGVVAYDVGLNIPLGYMWDTQLCSCGKEHVHRGHWWSASSLFRPLIFNSAHDELIEKIVEEKPDIIVEPEKEKA